MKQKIMLFVGLFLALSQITACSSEPGNDISTTDGTETAANSSVATGTESVTPEQTSAVLLSPLMPYAQTEEWDGEILLAVSAYSDILLSEEDKQVYPALADTLEQKNAMLVRSMEDEFDNLLSTAKEELSLLGADSFVTKKSTADTQIRRADSVVVSILSDSYLVYGNISDRGLFGTTYDTESGRELAITDVIRDMSRIPAIVKEELQSHTWVGEFLSDTAVEDYFRDTPADGLSWTLDNNGVTFYFGNCDVAEIGPGGRLAATVSFAEYPDLFEAKYTAVPDAYMTEIAPDHPFYVNIDNDEALEELYVTPFTDDSSLYYASFGIYIDADAVFYEFPADAASAIGGYHPYYVKTQDDRHYLYVFADSSELAPGAMKLRVIDLTGGTCKEVGDMHIGPGYIPVDCTYALTDPDNMILENFETREEAAAYRVGDNGMPIRK